MDATPLVDTNPPTSLVDDLTPHVHRLDTLDPRAPLDDLAVLRPALIDADVVGIGMTARGARALAEFYLLTHRLVRRLVEVEGFRTIAIEDAPDLGTRLDAHLRDGTGEVPALLADAWTPWRTGQFTALLTDLRRWNERHPTDPVRLVGIDTAPAADPLEADGHFATAILDERARTGSRIVFLGRAAHVAAAPLRASTDGPGVTRHPAGLLLRERLPGARYRAVALTFGRAGDPQPVPRPDPSFAESLLDAVTSDTSLLLLHDAFPPAIEAWLSAPTRLRTIGPAYDPARDTDHRIEANALRDWFDVVVHRSRATPADGL